MRRPAWRHIRDAIECGKGPGFCHAHEAERYWNQLDPVERYQAQQAIGVETAAEFAAVCVDKILARRAEAYEESHAH